MVDSIDQIDWQRVDLRDPTQRQALAESIAEIESASVEHNLFHDLAWLLEAEGREPDDVRVYVCRAGIGLSGYAPFVVQPWLMRFSRSLWISWFVRYDPGWEKNEPDNPERIVKGEMGNC